MDHPKKIKYKGSTYVLAGSDRYSTIARQLLELAKTGGHADELYQLLLDGDGDSVRYPVTRIASQLGGVASEYALRSGNAEALRDEFYQTDFKTVVDDELLKQIATAMALYDLGDYISGMAENMMGKAQEIVGGTASSLDESEE